MTPKDGGVIIDIGNSRAGHLVREVRNMINLVQNIEFEAYKIGY